MKIIKAISGIGDRLVTFEDDEGAVDTARAAHVATAASAAASSSTGPLVAAVDMPLVTVQPGESDAKAGGTGESALPPDGGVGVNAPSLPTDGRFADQFYLRNTTTGEFDLGLFRGNTSVWDEFTGAGVHVGIIDDGIEYDHPDLDANYDASLETVDGYHTTTGASHGTAVGGIIAAERNGVGTVGIAYNSQITMMGAINGLNSNINIADSIANAVNFDVINNSWGYNTP